MLKIMANENMDEWAMRPGVVEETVQAAKRFLEEHPEEMKKISARPVSSRIPWDSIIASFQNWPVGRVTDARASMSDQERGVLEKEASHLLPHQTAERRFARTIKTEGKSKPIPADVQVRAAKRIVEGGGLV